MGLDGLGMLEVLRTHRGPLEHPLLDVTAEPNVLECVFLFSDLVLGATVTTLLHSHDGAA